MRKEIERKFLVKKKVWEGLEKPKGEHFRQGYLLTEKEKSIRVRQTPTKGFITIKGATQGATRNEFEYEIPISDAKKLLDQFSVAELSKVRYTQEIDGNVWEVDEFEGENKGLIVAEIELKSEEEQFSIPEFIRKI